MIDSQIEVSGPYRRKKVLIAFQFVNDKGRRAQQVSDNVLDNRKHRDQFNMKVGASEGGNVLYRDCTSFGCFIRDIPYVWRALLKLDTVDAYNNDARDLCKTKRKQEAQTLYKHQGPRGSHKSKPKQTASAPKRNRNRVTSRRLRGDDDDSDTILPVFFVHHAPGTTTRCSVLEQLGGALIGHRDARLVRLRLRKYVSIGQVALTSLAKMAAEAVSSGSCPCACRGCGASIGLHFSSLDARLLASSMRNLLDSVYGRWRQRREGGGRE